MSPRPLALSLFACCLIAPAFAEETSPAELEFFEKKIRPVLAKHCYQCHSSEAKDVKGGLLLDTRDAMRQGGDSGSAVVPGDAEKSLILEAIRYDSFEMPPDKKLPQTVIADFAKWIEMGAPDPRKGKTKKLPKRTIDFDQARQFWSFQPPQRHEPPQVGNPQWVQRPVDAFVLRRLEARGLKPNPAADRRTLIRRVTFDLTGLPPTPAEVESFVNDPSPDAYEQLVDRLLASPQYGEHWARLWLDVARYAEDQAHIVGNNRSLFYPNAYLYRGWVIAALNDDLPYDRFIKLQLAADVLEPEDEAQRAALGFIGLGPKYYGRGSLEVQAEEWENQVDTVTRGLLGLTVACARCHDHKYDPIETRDYYALAGVFASTEMFNRPLNDQAKTKKNGQTEKPEEALHIVRDKEPRDLNVFIRGDVKSKGPVVERRFLRVLHEEEPPPFARGSGRLDLAESIAQRNNPLTARVIVNRVWAWNFGQPLVGTPSNFGALGERPTHPQLLDDLAVRFMENGWSLKWLMREMVLSATYRQTSEIDPKQQNVDAANRLLGRMNRKRLSVEAWRDAVLSVAGRLDTSAVGGKSIDPAKPEETRRTVYARISRLDLNPLLALFDFPDPNAHAAKRAETTTPLQKLYVLNNPFMVEQSAAVAKRMRTASDDPAEAIDHAYRLLYARPATPREQKIGQAFLGASEQSDEAWEQYAQILLAANEFFMID